MVEARETRQKNIIHKEIKNMRFFFGAEDLHKKVMNVDKSIGIATIYRFLNDLKKKREIHFYLCDRKGLYSLKNKNHSHFTCESCGRIEHINIESINFLKKFIEGDICHFQIEVSGICKNCKNKD